jgi:hypothetical protein
VTNDAFEGLINRSEIDGDTLVWESSLGPKWRRLDEIEGYKAGVDEPPPLPASHVSNQTAWFLAFVPIIGAFAENSMVQSGAQLSYGAILLCYCIVNSGLSWFDLRKIKAAGLRGRTLEVWTILLVPVYLYKRANYLGQPLHYFWAWIACLVVSTLIAPPIVMP